ADQLPNLHGSIHDYVRMLRIAREVADRVAPDVKIMPGGLRHEEFLAAVVTYTDNPDGGTVTAEYPETGAAYFDVIGFNHYGHQSSGSSDIAIQGLLDRKNRFANAAGDDSKGFFIFETGASRV